jgi:DNA polymerase III delta prime subunit
MSRNALWVEKYRPSKLEDVILPNALKTTLQQFEQSGEIPNMLFTGTAGVGKTTVAKAICNDLNFDHILINGSEQGNIDTLRGKIKHFASTVSLGGDLKVVILDEADYLNAQSTQPALRGFIEEFSDNCRFILTCNYKNKIIEPLHSRCSVYEFNTTKQDMVQLCQGFFLRVKSILEQEGVSVDKPTTEAIAQLIMRHAPDWRRVLNELQRHTSNGVLDLSGASKQADQQFNQLFDHLKTKQFNKMRQWVVDNVDIDTAGIFRGIYDSMSERVQPASIPQLVLILANYQYKQAFVADTELNMVACFTEIMSSVEFK